jgi:hypothetical protein
VRAAIVGSGLAALAAYATLRHGGIDAGEIAVFGTDDDPLRAWRTRAEAIRQQRMRSESDGHLAPAAFPGLAVRAAWQRGSVAPLLASVASRYHPTVEEFLEHGEEVRMRTGWDDSFRRRRVERIAAVDGGFELDGEGPFPHVLVATGHPGLAMPKELAGDPRAVHAYQPHAYASTVTVVGAGMAAATEWLNALAAGAEVVSVRRREPTRRPLNVPRPLFTKRGLAAYHATAPAQRATTLDELAAPSYPPGPHWDAPLAAAARDGRFRVEANVNGSAQVIAATGFVRGWANDPLLARLVHEHELETHDDWIVLAPDSTVPALTDERRTLALAGAAGQWAFPAADTIAGAKYAARSFLRRACRTR